MIVTSVSASKCRFEIAEIAIGIGVPTFGHPNPTSRIEIIIFGIEQVHGFFWGLLYKLVTIAKKINIGLSLHGGLILNRFSLCGVGCRGPQIYGFLGLAQSLGL